MRLIAFSLMELGFYLATGKAEYLDTAIALYSPRALKLAYAIAPEEPLRSWISMRLSGVFGSRRGQGVDKVGRAARR